MGKKSLLLNCPICGKETDIKVYDDTVMLKFPLCCSNCKKETLIDVAYLKMVPKSNSDNKTEPECC